jgi:hypothetical protein
MAFTKSSYVSRWLERVALRTVIRVSGRKKYRIAAAATAPIEKQAKTYLKAVWPYIARKLERTCMRYGVASCFLRVAEFAAKG